MQLFLNFDFAAARNLPNLPAEHTCARIHGHTFCVEIVLGGDVGERSGWIMDFADVEDAIERLKHKVDHQYLNNIEGLDNPTTELLAMWIWRALKPELPGLEQVKVQEHPSRGVIYSGDD